MIRKVVLLSLACLGLLLGELKAEETSEDSPPFVGLITADRVNCRAGPGFSYETLLQFSRGTHVHVLSKSGSWFSIRCPEDVPVYVFKGFLHLEGDQAIVSGQHVHVRAGPGQAYSSLGRLAPQQRVSVRRAVGDWVQIAPPDFCQGWVNQAYVTFLQTEKGEHSHGDDRSVPAASVESGPSSGSRSPSERGSASGS